MLRVGPRVGSVTLCSSRADQKIICEGLSLYLLERVIRRQSKRTLLDSLGQSRTVSDSSLLVPVAQCSACSGVARGLRHFCQSRFPLRCSVNPVVLRFLGWW